MEIACSLNDCFAAPALANTFAVGALVTPHIHTREDEYSIAIGFRSGDREAVQIISPAGFENFFRDLADLVARVPRRCKTLPLSLAITACSSVILPGYLI